MIVSHGSPNGHSRVDNFWCIYTECNEIANQVPWLGVYPGTVTIIYGSSILQPNNNRPYSRAVVVWYCEKKKKDIPSIFNLYQKHQYERTLLTSWYISTIPRRHPKKSKKLDPSPRSFMWADVYCNLACPIRDATDSFFFFCPRPCCQPEAGLLIAGE